MKEYSAGGIIEKDKKLLIVKVCNLSGQCVWTFPKGHLEKGETPLKAALREVQEETGWRCRSLGVLQTVAYKFLRGNKPVDKRVRWYRMELVEKTGAPDVDEILATRWVTRAQARKLLRYPSDMLILESL